MTLDGLRQAHSPEMMTTGSDLPKKENNRDIAVQVFNTVYKNDADLLGALANGHSFKSDSSKQEALQYVRDQIVEKALKGQSDMDWDIFFRSRVVRLKVYRRFILDYLRKNSIKTTYADDGSIGMNDKSDMYERINSRHDLIKIVDVLKNKKLRLRNETIEKFFVIIGALIEGKTAKEIIKENKWNFVESRITQIFGDVALIIQEEYPGFPSSINELRSILEEDVSDKNKADTAKYIIGILKSKESEITKSLEASGNGERQKLENHLLAIRSIFDSNIQISTKIYRVRRVIWQELFPNKVYVEWEHPIRKAIKGNNDEDL